MNITQFLLTSYKTGNNGIFLKYCLVFIMNIQMKTIVIIQ